MALRELTLEELEFVSGGGAEENNGQERREEVGKQPKMEPPGQEKKEN